MSSGAAATHLFIATPNDGSSRSPVERFATAMVELAGKPLASACRSVFLSQARPLLPFSFTRPPAALKPFPMPSLRVGSLDSLLALTDELARTDAFVESVFKKAERLVAETHVAIKTADYLKRAGAAADGAAMPPIKPLELYCCGMQVHDFVGSDKERAFAWSAKDWDEREALPELARRMLATAEKVDLELRAGAATHTEKKTALQASERKRGCVRGS